MLPQPLLLPDKPRNTMQI